MADKTKPAAALNLKRLAELARIEAQIRASARSKLTKVVNKHPDETLSIMRRWLANKNG